MSNSPFVIAEIGINHNGDINLAKKLINAARTAGCDAVKFQKRDIERVYSPEYLNLPRQSPWGETQRDQKQGLEFGKEEYDEIDAFCKGNEITWFASAWDLESQEFLNQYNLQYNKIASPMLTVKPLVEKIAAEKRYTFISTGMSTLEEIDRVVEIFESYDCPFELMHCNSSYPMNDNEANLNTILSLKERYNCDVGYSGHERGYQITLAAAALGATSIERHITLDRTMYGSDQAASIETAGLKKMVRDIKVISSALGDGKKRIYKSELPAREKLSKPFWYL